MTEEAERFKDEDKKKRELVEAKNGADALIHSTEKAMKDLGEKVAADDKTKIEAAIAEPEGGHELRERREHQGQVARRWRRRP